MEITGRLTSNAEVKTTKSDKEVVNFSIAVNDYYKTKGGEKKEITTYFDCGYWVSTKVAEKLTKGTIVLLYGRVGVNVYKNMNGDAKASLTFHVNNIKFMGGGKSNTTTTAQNATNYNPQPETIDDLPF